MDLISPARGLKLLQCTEAKKVFPLPQCIEANLWLLQPRPIECEHVAWRRVGMHAFEMPGHQRLHSIIAKVAGLDDGHRSQDIPASPAPARESPPSGRLLVRSAIE